MRVLIVGVGTRGDVAPYTGLGMRLREAGHEVAIAAHEPYAELVTDAGLEYLPLPGDPLPALTGRFSISAFKEYSEQLMDGLTQIAEQEADLLLLGMAGAQGCHVAEAMGVPSMGVHLQPIDPTGDFPPVMSLFRQSLGRWGNRRTARLAFESPAAGPLLAGMSTKMRARLGLPPMTPRALYRRREDTRWPVFHGVSPLVVPRPADWRPGLEITGYWWPLQPRGWQPDPVLRDFLTSGPPPVFVSAAGPGPVGRSLGRGRRGARRRGGEPAPSHPRARPPNRVTAAERPTRLADRRKRRFGSVSPLTPG
ncbi:glycosyltransferase [Streptosporangium sp. NBC_01495]|nr:glycosyltransferase [Streptosporangium sp. NBC_01495]